MGSLITLSLLFLISCSSPPRRKIASSGQIKIIQELSFEHSFTFIKNLNQNQLLYYFEARDVAKKLIDLESDSSLVNIPEASRFKLNRISKGRYEILVEPRKQGSRPMIYVGKNKIKLRLKESLSIPSLEFTQAKIFSRSGDQIIVSFDLKDRQNKSLTEVEDFEVIVEGDARLREVKRGDQGQLKAALTIPDYNQIIYLSLRVNGVYLPRIFRHQHIAKDD